MHRFAVVLAILALPSLSSAQRLLAHDTLTTDTPSVVSCGFCGDEVIGVVFRELGSGGLQAGDFPVELTSVQVALASATTDGTSCDTTMIGGSVTASVEIWAGPTAPETLPDEDVVFGMPWSEEETFLWGGDEIPITLSTPTADGETRFDLQFNAYVIADPKGDPLIVPAGNRYIRVAVRLPGGGGNNSVCVDPVEVPGGFPLRDNDGVIANLRSHIYGAGIGWRWNETVGLGGDWAIRLEVDPMGTPVDGGVADGGGGTDSGGPADVGAIDAGAGVDTGTSVPGGGGGCGCRAGGSRSGLATFAVLALTLGIVARRRREPS